MTITIYEFNQTINQVIRNCENAIYCFAYDLHEHQSINNADLIKLKETDFPQLIEKVEKTTLNYTIGLLRKFINYYNKNLKLQNYDYYEKFKEYMDIQIGDKVEEAYTDWKHLDSNYKTEEEYKIRCEKKDKWHFLKIEYNKIEKEKSFLNVNYNTIFYKMFSEFLEIIYVFYPENKTYELFQDKELFDMELIGRIYKLFNTTVNTFKNASEFYLVINNPKKITTKKTIDIQNRTCYLISQLSNYLIKNKFDLKEIQIWESDILNYFDIKRESYKRKVNYCNSNNASEKDDKFKNELSERLI